MSFVTISVFEFCHNFCVWVLSQYPYLLVLYQFELSLFDFLSFVKVWVLDFCANLIFLSFGAIWVFEFCYYLIFFYNLSFWVLSKLTFWVLSQFELENIFDNFSFWILSHFLFFSFVRFNFLIWFLLLFEFLSCNNLNSWVLSQFEFCHILSFWVLTQFEVLSFKNTLFFLVLSQFEFLSEIVISSQFFPLIFLSHCWQV